MFIPKDDVIRSKLMPVGYITVKRLMVNGQCADCQEYFRSASFLNQTFNMLQISLEELGLKLFHL